MIFAPAILSLSLLPFCVAQASSVAIEAIEANFANAGIVPSLLATFSPSSTLSVNFAGVGDVAAGTPLTQAQVKPMPDLSVTPADSTVTFSGNYTLAMVDAGPVGFDESQGQTRHMLINSVTIEGSNVSTAAGLAITAYAGPAPPSGSGPHRYVILLYSQPSSFTPPANLSTAGVAVSTYDFPAYVKSTGLGPLVAANYFTVEAGTASASISPTSAVITSTLSPVASASSAGAPQTTAKANSARDIQASILMILLPGALALTLV
ncbi:PEBP-like protein [Athelia psychrophila]|uniref:PEBP-like protein n=1 Tax=Athelia psychrophila TaxID=1759441 RepID=A0A166NC45_9AGAM|nr:PEBP-like protein [Fibularhizoctonia sp. CBS 109695]